MQNLWGIPITIVGLLMLAGGLSKSNFLFYRLLAARLRILWGDHVHRFYIVAGFLVAVFGVLVGVGIVQR